jgi:hypothetical protein
MAMTTFLAYQNRHIDGLNNQQLHLGHWILEVISAIAHVRECYRDLLTMFMGTHPIIRHRTYHLTLCIYANFIMFLGTLLSDGLKQHADPHDTRERCRK